MKINWAIVAEQCGADSADGAEATWNEMSQEFMTPVVELMTDNDAPDMGDQWNGPGWYGRLSASGYLDCTDWTGPFEDAEHAIAQLILDYD